MRRVLVANRGEIAVRIIRACREAGLESIAVYSDVDRNALHVRSADRAERIGPASPAESYLSVAAILGAAERTGADALHPGYGFLSERPELAAACESAGVTFIGPPASVIARMGSKIAARELMRQSGVPLVPGITPVDQTDDGIAEAARRIGVPLLIKASAGGGGKGMRQVRSEDGLAEAIASARREAAAAFGDGTLYVERLIERPRHVEIQILADAHGNVVHLFERECSLQRRHQKIVEESPSPAVTPRIRAQMGDAAVTAARAAGYRNAGTIEFLLEGDGDDARFYFLEMNTRLQVEHPVTEAVTGIDLVRAQLQIAEGLPLPWAQQVLSQRGHAVECRVYAEDPFAGFLPQAGPLSIYREPSGPGIRVDSGVSEGEAIGVHYDPMIAKVIAHGESRERALDRLTAALRAYPILGTRTNLSFLVRLLDHPAVRAGAMHTSFVDAHLDDLTVRGAPPVAAVAAAAALGEGAPAGATGGPSRAGDPWETLKGWGR